MAEGPADAPKAAPRALDCIDEPWRTNTNLPQPMFMGMAAPTITRLFDLNLEQMLVLGMDGID